EVVLRAELKRIVGAVRMLDPLLPVDQQLDALIAHRGEMGAAGDETDLRAGPCEPRPEKAADGTGTVDADLHRTLPRSGSLAGVAGKGQRLGAELVSCMPEKRAK